MQSILFPSRLFLTSKVSWQSFPGYGADAGHVIMQNGLLAPIVPLQRHAGPVRLGDGGLVILVVSPTDTGADA